MLAEIAKRRGELGRLGGEKSESGREGSGGGTPKG